MKLRFEIDQADSFRHGIDRSKSIVSVDVNPADLPQETRSLIAEHLVGIDVLQFFYHDGQVIKGHPIRELSYTSREPKRIVAKAVNLEALVEAIKLNDTFIAHVKASFDHPVQFRIIDNPPKDAAGFEFISDQSPTQIQELRAAIGQKRRVYSDCFLAEVQNLRQELHANSYSVYLLPLPASTAQGRFYCEPVFAAEFSGRQVVAHSPTIVLNEKTGRIFEVKNLFQALEIYMLSGMPPGILINDLVILRWDGNKWGIVLPEGIIRMANDAKPELKGEPEEA
ncbi:MAG: hypothetical protein ABSH34_19235 [Verrucomicrobiota bacterium]|jgi:hypothetical protein